MVRLVGRSICPRKVVKDFWGVHFSCIAMEDRFADSNMNGFSSFSGSLFAALVYYFEVGDVGFGMIVGHTVLVNCTGDISLILFSKHLLDSPGQDHSEGNVFLDAIGFYLWVA